VLASAWGGAKETIIVPAAERNGYWFATGRAEHAGKRSWNVWGGTRRNPAHSAAARAKPLLACDGGGEGEADSENAFCKRRGRQVDEVELGGLVSLLRNVPPAEVALGHVALVALVALTVRQLSGAVSCAVSFKPSPPLFGVLFWSRQGCDATVEGTVLAYYYFSLRGLVERPLQSLAAPPVLAGVGLEDGGRRGSARDRENPRCQSACGFAAQALNRWGRGCSQQRGFFLEFLQCPVSARSVPGTVPGQCPVTVPGL